MKYIRIKNGIYEIVKSYEDNFVEIKIGKERHFISKKIKLKSADTIDELCDYIFFRCLDLGGEELVIKKLPLDYSLEKLYKDMEIGLVKDVKLAILTNEGLIYVAKMNDKGELKLLQTKK